MSQRAISVVCRRSRKTCHMLTAANTSGKLWPVSATVSIWLSLLPHSSLPLPSLVVLSREAGIACNVSPGSSESLDSSRTELLALLLVCFSESLYYTQEGMLMHKGV